VKDHQVLQIDYLYCDADKHKLGRVFRNLFSNAVKFTSEGGRIVTTACALLPIEINPSQQEPSSVPTASSAVFPTSRETTGEQSRATHMLRIEVSDDGAGLSKVRQARVYLMG